jgi:methylenetetrahydrofolate--tRNA-(uracil-5-)-methyltransferase
VIGGGLAGCEAAWQAAERGCSVRLCEMRPAQMTGAHLGGALAELVAPTPKAQLPDRASGSMNEIELLGSMLLEEHARASPGRRGAGGRPRSLLRRVTARLGHPQIQILRERFARCREDRRHRLGPAHLAGPCPFLQGPLGRITSTSSTPSRQSRAAPRSVDRISRLPLRPGARRMETT